MARSLRIDVQNGWYHVLNRGVERRQIFPDEESNLHFLELLGCFPARFGVRIHGYVLMGNHYHLQLETPQANLSRTMLWLNLSYGAWFNRRHQRLGPLFQGRFHTILHEAKTSGLQIIDTSISIRCEQARWAVMRLERPQECNLESAGAGGH
jgi:REP-associated tyrosine transposase